MKPLATIFGSLPRLVLLGLLLAAGVSLIDAAEHAGHRRFGGGRPIVIAELPPSELRQRLEALPDVPRQRALQQLAEMRFDEGEVPHLHVFATGDVVIDCAFTDPGTTALAPATGPGIAALPSTAPVAPIYHSRPGSSNVLFLDFNGEDVTNSIWNQYYNPVKTPLRAVPFDYDGDYTTFSATELAVIQDVWRRVAEDYAPFDIDVTTEPPASYTATTGHVIITHKHDANGDYLPYAATTGGVARPNVFGRSDYAYHSPAWVYYDNFGQKNHIISEACSHEFGHNLGLSHDGLDTVTGDNYYGGHGTGLTSWMPIMGAGNSHNVTQWSKGEYTNANNQEDDLAMIAAKLSYRADDHGNTAGTATALPVSGNSFTGTGVIGTTADLDAFLVTVGAGTLTIQGRTFRSAVETTGCNLDMRIRLLDAGGNVLADANPSLAVNATCSASVAAGTYTIMVEGVGDPGIYTDYGSLGQYTLTGTCATNVNAAPVAAAGLDQAITLPTSSVTLTGSATDSDGTIASYTWSKLSGGTTTIVSPASATTSITGLGQGTYVFRLTVTDDDGATDTDDVQVTVNPAANVAPVANAGSDQAITLPMSSVTLSGSATDNVSVASYAWTKISGGAATITTPAAASTMVTGLVAGTYVFRLTATDNQGATGFDEVQITVTAANTPPTVNAGATQTITLPTSSVTLSGSATDNGTVTSYAWVKISGGAATITTPSAASTTLTGLVAGTYVFRLTATDNQGATGFDEVQVTVNAANTSPLVNAGVDQTITVPTASVTLSGSATDNGSVAIYAWTKVSGGAATITMPSSASTTVTGLVAGTYVFRLTATDNQGATGFDEVRVTVNAANTSPLVDAGEKSSTCGIGSGFAILLMTMSFALRSLGGGRGGRKSS